MQETGFIKGFVALLDRQQIGLSVVVVTDVKLEMKTTATIPEIQ